MNMHVRQSFKLLTAVIAVLLCWLAAPPGSSAATAHATGAGARSAVFADVQPGWYRIKNVRMGPSHCLQANPTGGANSGVLHMRPCARTGEINKSQEWFITGTNEKHAAHYRYVRNGGVPGCLDAQSRGRGLTRAVTMYENCNESPNQAWAFFQHAYHATNTTQQYVCTAAAAKCDIVWDMDINNEGERVNLWDANALTTATHQHFFLERIQPSP